MTQPKRRPPRPPEQALRDLTDILMGFSRISRAPRRSRPRAVEPTPGLEHHEPIPKVEAAVVVKPEPIEIEVLGPKLEPAMKLVGATDQVRRVVAPPVPAPADQQASPVQQASRGRFVPGEQQRPARGGTARSRSLTPEQRRDIARRGASARWGGKTQEAR